jgi:Flp pilus assembly protein TadD
MTLTLPPSRISSFACAISLLLSLALLGGCGGLNAQNRSGSDGSEAGSAARLSGKSSAQLIEEGRAYLSRGDLAMARMHFMVAAERDSGSAEVYAGLGQCELQTGRVDAAMAYFEKALAIEPDHTEALLGEARIYRRQNKLSLAVERTNRALAKSPEDIRVIMELATIYDLMGEPNLSRPLYDEIITRQPDSAANYNNLGLNQIVSKQYSPAIESLTRAVRLDTSDPRIRNNLATAYLLNGNEAEALLLFGETVGEAAAYNNIGYLYMTQGRLDDAERALRLAISTNSQFYEKAQENLDRVRQLRRARADARADD